MWLVLSENLVFCARQMGERLLMVLEKRAIGSSIGLSILNYGASQNITGSDKDKRRKRWGSDGKKMWRVLLLFNIDLDVFDY